MGDTDLSLQEEYLLSSKSQVLNKLIKGTDNHYYLTFIGLLAKQGLQLSNDQEKDLEMYLKNFSSQRAKNIKLRALFRKYDSEKSQKVLNEINDQLFHIKFDHSQPSRVKGTGKLAEQLNQKQSQLEQFSYEQPLEAAYNSIEGLNNISQQLYSKLDLKRLANSPEQVCTQFLKNSGHQIISFDGIPQFLSIYTERMKQRIQNFEIEPSLFQRLSLQQMEESLRLIPSLATSLPFIGQLFLKKFQYDLTRSGKSYQEDLEEKKAKLTEMYEWAKQLPPVFESLSDQLLYERLQIGIDTNDYDFDLFFIYLKNPKALYQNCTETQRKQYNTRNKSYQSQWHSFHAIEVSKWLSDNNLVEKYLEKFFSRPENDIQTFEDFLDKKYLNTIRTKVQLYMGNEVLGVNEILPASQLKQLADEKLIQICNYNKDFFSQNEEVKLFVELKNITKLTIKIFEFCSENYYQKTQKEIEPTINLDGLIATEEQVVTYNEPPIVKKVQEFTFDTITKKQRGIFIVEFIGNGLSSRAIIKKGKLLLKEKLTVAGQVFQVLDENLEICSGARTGLWIQGRFYQVDKERQEVQIVIIPFPNSTQSLQSVIVHEDFAQLTNVTLQKEAYNFVCAYIYSTESMLMSSKAKVLISPKLYLLDLAASLKLLSEFQVQVTLVNDADIPSTLTFDDLKLSPTEELEIEFPIGAKSKSISIQVKAKVSQLHPSEENQKQTFTQTVSSNHSITFNNASGQNMYYLILTNLFFLSFCSQFLRLTEDQGYQLFLLGKNGEPKSNVDVRLSIQVSNINKQYENTLTTDNEGKISLGSLENVVSINSQVLEQGDIKAIPQYWYIKNNSRIKYPNSLKLIQGEKLVLPFLEKDNNSNQVLLYRIFEGKQQTTNLYCLNNLIKVENHQLIIEGLEIGNYQLLIRDGQIQISIEVLQGKLWKNTNLIITKNQLIETNQRKNQLMIVDVNIKESDVEAKIMTQYPNQTRIHVIAFQFIPPGAIDQLCQDFAKTVMQSSEKSFSTILPYNTYFSNKKLSDEQKYVLDRQNQERYIGNTLEKPQILLKRQFIRDTDVTTEQLEGESDYTQKEARETLGMMSKKMGASHSRIAESSVQNQVNAFLNFLQYPALVIGNIKVVDQVAKFQIPAGRYSSVFLLATDNTNAISHLVPLPSGQIQTRDLTQKSSLEKDKFYSIFRSDQKLDEGNKAIIADLTSTDIQFVDSTSKLWVLLKELRKCEGSDNEQTNGFQYWEFLSKWSRLTMLEKLKKFDEFVCDEMNIFLYFKDRAFFETYTKSYIQNKIEKTFVDFFLLEDENNLVDFAQPQNLSKLNGLEQALLVIFLQEVSKNESNKLLAQQIVSRMDNKNKLVPVDQKEYKRLFDTVLDAKTADGQTTQKESLQRSEGMRVQRECAPMMMMANRAPMPMARMMVQQNFMVQQQMMPQCAQMSVQNDMYDMSEEANYNSQNQDYYVEKRKQIVDSFQNLEKTKEYCEKHYAKTTTIRQNIGLVPLNSFWVELAKYSLTKGVLSDTFLSSKFIFCNKNHTQMIGVLTFMGVPFESPNHVYSPFEGKGVEIAASGNLLMFTKEIKEGKADLKVDILVAQRFFDPKNRYVYDDEDPTLKIEKDIDEYIVNRIYGCQVIVTNCSVTKQDFQVLVEVPEGSIPVNTTEYTKINSISLEPYTTKTFDFYFYFPKQGTFGVYPANVARSGIVMAVAKQVVLKVLNEKTTSSEDHLDDLLTRGSNDDILKFLETKNIFNTNIFNYQDIYYLLKDREFYIKLIDVFRRRRVFDFTTWSYSLLHNDLESLQEFFNCQQNLDVLNNQFKYFKCSLFEVSSVRFLEYYPLVTSRVHQISDKNNILNIQFREQYKQFIEYLIEKDEFSTSDQLVFIYYLLLQERINEAKGVFQKMKNVEGEAVLQYDYFSAYLDFYIGFPNFQKAREICEKYLDYPVIQWRNLFYEVANQLAEYDGDELIKKESEDVKEKKQKNNENAEKEEALNLELEGSTLIISHTNIQQLTIQFYQIDLEVLYSRNPFLSQGVEDFAFIQANYRELLEVNSEKKIGIAQTTRYEIPEKMKKYNLFIEVGSLNKKATSRYFSTTLKVQVIENYGQVKVQSSEGKQLSRVYVKTFSKDKSGKVSFYKDGYTDLRGRFDYASLNPDSLKNVDKFSIFVMSDELGSLIKEVNAPVQVGRYDQEVSLISQTQTKKATEQRQLMEQEYTKNVCVYNKKK